MRRSLQALETSMELFDRCCTVWRQAACELRIKATVPYRLIFNSVDITLPAYLPHFGGPGGMIVELQDPKTTSRSKFIAHVAKRMNMHYTLLYATTCQAFDREECIEMLTDCGFYGPPEEFPAWLTKRQMP